MALVELPSEILISIMDWLEPDEEFPVALVCRQFYNILRRKRDLRGNSKWMTSLTPLCRTFMRCQWIYNTTATANSREKYYIEGQILGILIKTENYDVLEDFLNHFEISFLNSCGLTQGLMEQEAYDCVYNLLIKGRLYVSPEDFDLAIESGELDLVELMYEHHGGSLDSDHMRKAILSGNTDIVKFVYKEGIATGGQNMYICVETGNLDIVKFAHENLDVIYEHDSCLEKALEDGNLDIVDYLNSIKSNYV